MIPNKAGGGVHLLNGVGGVDAQTGLGALRVSYAGLARLQTGSAALCVS